jgi:MinD-like ATPase involved in chromosome partitioning or flagellar assembly
VPLSAEPLPAGPAPAEPASAEPEDGALEAQAPQAEVSRPATEVPAPEVEVAAPEVQVPEAQAPEAPEPEAVTPEAAAPEAVAPEAVTPEAVAPEAVTPEAVAPEAVTPEVVTPEAVTPATQEPEAEAPAPPVAARVLGVDRERPLPSIEWALSGPGCGDDVSWRRQVKVVAGGQGPGKRDQETLDRDRVRAPLAGPRRIVVLGCTRGAGQTVTALMTSDILATVRGDPVAALDLNPGPTSLAARRPPATSVYALLAGQPGHSGPGARLDVIADLPGDSGNAAAHALDGDDFRRLADVLAEQYPLTMIDPAASGLTRVLSAADLLVLVAPASPDAATSLANTQQWLGAHGHGELADRAVTVVNGVSRRTREDVLRAESVARGRCRAIVRVPWDDLLSSRPGLYHQATLQPQTRLAYTALAGVLVTGLGAAALSPVPGRDRGEHSD